MLQIGRLKISRGFQPRFHAGGQINGAGPGRGSHLGPADAWCRTASNVELAVLEDDIDIGRLEHMGGNVSRLHEEAVGSHED